MAILSQVIERRNVANVRLASTASGIGAKALKRTNANASQASSAESTLWALSELPTFGNANILFTAVSAASLQRGILDIFRNLPALAGSASRENSFNFPQAQTPHSYPATPYLPGSLPRSSQPSALPRGRKLACTPAPATARTRVLAEKHFPTDVLLSSAAGAYPGNKPVLAEHVAPKRQITQMTIAKIQDEHLKAEKPAKIIGQ